MLESVGETGWLGLTCHTPWPVRESVVRTLLLGWSSNEVSSGQNMVDELRTQAPKFRRSPGAEEPDHFVYCPMPIFDCGFDYDRS